MQKAYCQTILTIRVSGISDLIILSLFFKFQFWIPPLNPGINPVAESLNAFLLQMGLGPPKTLSN